MKLSRYKIKYLARETYKTHPVFLLMTSLLGAVLSFEFVYRFQLGRILFHTVKDAVANSADGSIDFLKTFSDFFQELKTQFLHIITAKSQSVTLEWLFFYLVILIVFIFFLIYIKNAFTVTSARIFLESASYGKVPVSRFYFLYHEKSLENAALAVLRRDIFVFLWCFTIVGGVIKTLQYALVPSLLAENPKLSGKDAMARSKKLMKGHKTEYLLMQLSFIPWDLLSVASFGTLRLAYVGPYRKMANQEFYLLLREAYQENHEYAEVFTDSFLSKEPTEQELLSAYGPKEELVEKKKRIRSGIFASLFGIVLRHDERDISYRDQVVERTQQKADNMAWEKRTYPTRLFMPQEEKRPYWNVAYFVRHYSVLSLLCILVLSAGFGIVMETVLSFMTTSSMSISGSHLLFWAASYGIGSFLVLIVCHSLHGRPVITFAASGVAAFLVEWFGGLLIQKNQWFDIETAGFMRIEQGGFRPESILFFAVFLVALVYVFAPIMDNVFYQRGEKI